MILAYAFMFSGAALVTYSLLMLNPALFFLALGAAMVLFGYVGWGLESERTEDEEEAS